MMKCDGCGKEMESFDFITGTAKNNDLTNVEFKVYCGKCAVYLDIKNQLEIDNIIERDLQDWKLEQIYNTIEYNNEHLLYPSHICGVSYLDIIRVLNFLIKKRRLENNG